VRRLSVASLDSGAESPVYGEEPSASVGRGNTAAGPPWAGDGGPIVAGEPAWRLAPPAAALPSAQQVSAEHDQAARDRYLAPAASVSSLGGAVGFGGISSLRVPPGGETRDITVTVDWMLRRQVGTGAPRLTASYDTSVVDRQSGRWYVEDIRASTQPMGTQ
jgi:hypothetical protein